MEWKRNVFGLGVLTLFVVSLTGCGDDGGSSPYKDEYEPNNVITAPTDIILGTTYDASISKGDRDFYRFTVDNLDVLENVLIALGNFSEDLQLEASIYDGYGSKKITYWGEVGFGYPIYWPTTGDTYYLEIRDKNDGAKGDYTITVTDLDDGDTNEPNDGFTNATPITTYPTVISATITASSDGTYVQDWDYFQVIVSANKKVKFTITPESANLTMQFKTYDDTYNEISGLVGIAGLPLNDDDSLNNTTGADVTFFVKVGAVLGTDYEINYTISFAETDADGG